MGTARVRSLIRRIIEISHEVLPIADQRSTSHSRSLRRGAVLAMVAARIVAPHTKLATTRWWHTTTLAADFGVADADEDDLYAAMDWLLARQDAGVQNRSGAVAPPAGSPRRAAPGG